MEKQIKITPSLFSLKKTKKSLGKKKVDNGKSKKNITAFLNRIKEHAKNKTKNSNSNNTNPNEELAIDSHISYLEQLKQNQKKKQSRKKKYQVNIELDHKLEKPPESNFKPKTDSLQEVNVNDLLNQPNKEKDNLNISTVKIDKQPINIDTETIKLDSYPINNSPPVLNDPAPIKNNIYKPGPEKPWGNLKNGPKPTYREWKNKTQKNISTKSFLKKKVKKYKYSLGKKDGKISVLIKNNKTRKAIQEDKKRLESATLIEVKDYLKKHFLYKPGSAAPPELLREIYRSSHLAGAPVTNISKDNLINNFYKLD